MGLSRQKLGVQLFEALVLLRHNAQVTLAAYDHQQDAQRLALGVSDATADQSRPRSRSVSPRRLPTMGAGCAAHRPRRRR
eukprot:COSAG01_NODE_104_length_26171_cov_96.617612_16_plen_80_part_00